MRKINEILRLKYEAGLSLSKIAQSCNVSKSTVSDILKRFDQSGLSWPLPEGMEETDLEARLYPTTSVKKDEKPLPDLAYIHQELKRKHVTLRLLWEEYKEIYPNGYQYSYFCEIYHAWRQKLDVSLRQPYPYGKYMEVDFAGQTMPIMDPQDGAVTEAQIFVAVLSATNYSFVMAVASQNLYDWIEAHRRALEYFGGVTEIIKPDNLKSAIKKSCRYEPETNPTYLEFAHHYETAVVPARPRKARDKNKAENAVLIVERWILARLRNITFFSIAELNDCIAELLEEYNNKPFQKLEGCRRELFEKEEKPLLKPLPRVPYEFAEWKKATVNIDSHVEVKYCYYSVPYQLIKEKVDVRVTVRVVELFYKGKRVASHRRCMKKGEFKTIIEHLPSSHQKHLEWSPSRILTWAEKNGPYTGQLVQELMDESVHVEHSYRRCLGVLRLASKYGAERLNNACQRALHFRAISFKSVKSILEKGLDKHPLKEKTEPLPLWHQNVRGSEYYEEG